MSDSQSQTDAEAETPDLTASISETSYVNVSATYVVTVETETEPTTDADPDPDRQAAMAKREAKERFADQFNFEPGLRSQVVAERDDHAVMDAGFGGRAAFRVTVISQGKGHPRDAEIREEEH